MRRRYGLRFTGANFLFRKYWTVAGAFAAQSKFRAKYGWDMEVVIINYNDIWD